MKTLKIGNVTLENSYILGPMAGVTDLPFRLLCKEQGAGLLCMEMVSAKGILYHNKNTESLLTIHSDEVPVSLQLFGSEPKIVSEMAKRIEERPFSFLDINMGCPVPKVVRNGEGSALMKNPKLVFELVNAVVKAIQKPVTVKIRKGFDDTCINAVEIAKIIEEAGASAIAVHGRTREQYYSGKADWEIIREVKEAVHIPVIGNGDVTSPQKAEEMRQQTGCDGVMVARAAEGNPWIFAQLCAYEETGKILEPPSFAEVKQMILRHAAMQIAWKGEFSGMREMRKHVAWYTKGRNGSARFRDIVHKVATYEELKQLLEEWEILER
ncbi:MAG: tRNA dihydrouridine synthase DusB [Hespellia sp.]|nr:tRNA dihydrouridine synthase DusB [Hespellia sp.]